MVYEASCILSYYLMGPLLYKYMDVTFAAVTPVTIEAGDAMYSIHQIFQYGFPALLVFAMLAGVGALWIYARRTYYASGTVWAQ
jgi:hypothetical protein